LGGEKLKSPRLCFRVLLLVLFLITGFFSIVIPSFAQTAPDPLSVTTAVDESTIILGDAPVSQASDGGSTIFIMLRMVLVLALAALSIYGVVFFIKRISRPKENPDPHLKVLARVPLSNDSFAAVVSLGAKAWLVGGAPGGVNLISEVEDAESLETLLLDDARKAAEMRRYFDFRSLLRFGRNERKLPLQESTHPDIGSLQEGGYPLDSGSLAESLRKQRERLKGL